MNLFSYFLSPFTRLPLYDWLTAFLDFLSRDTNWAEGIINEKSSGAQGPVIKSATINIKYNQTDIISILEVDMKPIQFWKIKSEKNESLESPGEWTSTMEGEKEKGDSWLDSWFFLLGTLQKHQRPNNNTREYTHTVESITESSVQTRRKRIPLSLENDNRQKNLIFLK